MKILAVDDEPYILELMPLLAARVGFSDVTTFSSAVDALDTLVNGKAIGDYFGRQTSIMIVKQPLMLTNNGEAFDIKVNVHGGGESGQAGAVRHGLTRALIDFDAALKPELSRAGYVTRDAREVERKKVGLHGARRRKQFSKR